MLPKPFSEKFFLFLLTVKETLSLPHEVIFPGQTQNIQIQIPSQNVLRLTTGYRIGKNKLIDDTKALCRQILLLTQECKSTLYVSSSIYMISF